MKSLENPPSPRITMPASKTKKGSEKTAVLIYKMAAIFLKKVHIKTCFSLQSTKKHIDAECSRGVEASGCLYKASKSATMAAALSPKPRLHYTNTNTNISTNTNINANTNTNTNTGGPQSQLPSHPNSTALYPNCYFTVS